MMNVYAIFIVTPSYRWIDSLWVVEKSAIQRHVQLQASMDSFKVPFDIKRLFLKLEDAELVKPLPTKVSL